MECSIPEINNFHNLQNNLKLTIQLPTFRDKPRYYCFYFITITTNNSELHGPKTSNFEQEWFTLFFTRSPSDTRNENMDLYIRIHSTYDKGWPKKNVRIWMFSCCPPLFYLATMFRTDFENLIEWILDEKHVKRVKFHNSQ